MENDLFHFLVADLVCNVIIFGVAISSSVYIDNKKKHILILGESPTQGLDSTTITQKKQVFNQLY